MTTTAYAPTTGMNVVIVGAPASAGSQTPADGRDWEIWVRERDGTRVTQLTRANLGPISENLNEPWDFSFQTPLYADDGTPHAETAEAQIVVREVEVLRGGRMRFQGPILARSIASGEAMVNVSCKSVNWYWQRRLWGGNPWARNWLNNGDFALGLRGWFGANADLDTVVFETGTQSVRFDDETGILATAAVVDLSVPFGVIATARVWIEAGVDDGQVIFWLDSSEAFPGSFTGYAPADPIDATTTRGAWTTLTISAPAGPTPTDPVRYYPHIAGATGGKVWVDRVTFTVSQVEGFAYDETPIIAPSPGEMIRTSSDGLNIGYRHVGTDIAGGLADADRFISECFEPYVAGGVYDVGEHWTRTTRTTITYAPRQGIDNATELTCPGNLAAFDMAEDGTQARSRMVMLGEDGYRGDASDAEAWGGLRLEDMKQAPTGTPLGDLRSLAARELRKSLGDVTSLSVSSSDPDLIDDVALGDRVAVTIAVAGLDAATKRITQRVVDPNFDQVTLTLVDEPAP